MRAEGGLRGGEVLVEGLDLGAGGVGELGLFVEAEDDGDAGLALFLGGDVVVVGEEVFVELELGGEGLEIFHIITGIIIN